MNKFGKFVSWCFSLGDWKPEKLIKDGFEYQYVAVDIK